MLGDKIKEEIEYEQEIEADDQRQKAVRLYCEVTDKLRFLRPKFWVIGINPKERIWTCKQVDNKEEAYELIKNRNLTMWVFADNIWHNFNTQLEAKK